MSQTPGAAVADASIGGAGERLAVLVSAALANRIFDEASRAQARELGADRFPASGAGEADMTTLGSRTEYVITGWDTPTITEDMLDRAPNLRLIAHTGGTVRAMLPRSIYDRGIALTTVSAVLGESVAEYTLMAILAGLRRLCFFANEMAGGTPWEDLAIQPATRSLHGRVVGIIGASQVGRALIALLRPFECRVLVSDPFLTADDAAVLGVSSVGLHELLGASDIVSVHAPVLPETVGLLGASELSRIKDGALIVNSARAALVDSDALERELRKGRLTAVLDVFDMEPLPRDSEWRMMPGTVSTPHIAALTTDTLLAQGREAVREVGRLAHGAPLRYPVSRTAFDRIA